MKHVAYLLAKLHFIAELEAQTGVQHHIDGSASGEMEGQAESSGPNGGADPARRHVIVTTRESDGKALPHVVFSASTEDVDGQDSRHARDAQRLQHKAVLEAVVKGLGRDLIREVLAHIVSRR